jgi:hypothetical protein
MKKFLFILFGVLLSGGLSVFGQRSCGTPALKSAIIAKRPAAALEFEIQRNSLQGIADRYAAHKVSGTTAGKTTAASAIPVIFHVIVTEAQFNGLGGTAGIARRCDSQIAVLERDFNRQNADSTSIPALWKPLYADAAIHFGLAHTSPVGWGTPGYEIKIVSPTTFFYASSGGYDGYGKAKHESTEGLDAWDVSKYFNVWCISFADNPSLLGLTVPKSFTPASFPLNEEGICINYSALGKRVSDTDIYPSHFDLGRTLTHECGHFFEIWHTWGDDGGACPWTGSNKDDGLSDTPPEADFASGNPVYTITDGTVNDGCQDSLTIMVQPIGTPCLDFMDYTQDVAMHLFTPQQAAVMRSQVDAVGENYSLTQHPELLVWPANAGISQREIQTALSIYPNPSTGIFTLTYDQSADELHEIEVVSTVGSTVKNIMASGQRENYYSIDLSAMSKGIYFVRCTFASGSITRKILLQ